MSYRTCQNILLGGLFLLLIAFIFSPLLQNTARTNLQQFANRNVSAATIVKVWVFQKTGLYFCPDSQFYGKFKPGTFMIQEEALQEGYQPAGQQVCQ